MQVSKRILTQTPSGTPVYGFRLTNSAGAYVELTNWGARWLSAVVPDANGVMANVITGYDNEEELMADDFYMGAVIGRFANRIGGAAFTLDGIRYELERNDGDNTNHGGFSGFHRKVWQDELLEDGVRFTLVSPDGEGGYPGTVRVTAEYRWNERNELTLRFGGTTDAPTYLNLTNHAYFNLSGQRGSVEGHELRIPASTILDNTAAFIPTGRRTPVTGTPFDFTRPKAVGRNLHEDNEQLKWNRGYNHCFILKEEKSDEMKMAGEVYEPSTGRTLTVCTDYPAVLLYSAGYYTQPTTALCLETQYFPDTPSHADFPSCLLRPGEVFRQQTVYAFGIRR